jgi:hypothetical protein
MTMDVSDLEADAHEVLQPSSASDLAGVANDTAYGSALGVATVGAVRYLTRSAHYCYL